MEALELALPELAPLPASALPPPEHLRDLRPRIAATQQQAVHEDRLRTADRVDPRVDTSSDDYAPGTTTHDHGTTARDRDTVLDADDPRRTDGGTHRA